MSRRYKLKLYYWFSPWCIHFLYLYEQISTSWWGTIKLWFRERSSYWQIASVYKQISKPSSTSSINSLLDVSDKYWIFQSNIKKYLVGCKFICPALPDISSPPIRAVLTWSVMSVCAVIGRVAQWEERKRHDQRPTWFTWYLRCASGVCGNLSRM